MRRISVTVGLVLLFVFPAKATITEIQHPQTRSSTCSKTVNTCSLTVSPTGSGHFGIVMITLLSASNTWVTSVTDNQGGVWTVPGNTGSGGCYLFTGAYGTTGCAFNLALPAGVTSITGTWSSVVPEGAEMDFREYSYTGSSVALDSMGSYGHAPQVPSPLTGIVPTLSGTNDVIVQSFATGSDYATGVSVYENANIGNAYFGSADLLNTVSTTPPTFTLCCTTAAYAFIYVAIKELDNFDIYVAQNAAGKNNGADCADAFAYSTVSFNTFGTTYHLCGTFSMPAGSNGPIAITGSGTSTSPITIKFESGARASAPYWGPNGFIYASNVSFLTVDGGTNGSISATANGTALANQVTPTSGITFVNVSNAEIKNLSVSNIYVHAASPNDEIGTQDTWGIQWTNGSNVTIDSNTVNDAYGCIYYQSAPNATSSNIRVFNNTAYNCNWSITTSAGGAGAILNTDLIYGNVLHDWANWDETANQNAHGGISVFATGSGAQVNGLQVYKNLVYGNMTTMTGYLYLSQPPGTITNPYVFNNIFYNTSTGYPANGYIYDYSTGANVFNNTVVGGSASTSGGSGYVLNGSGSTLYNNIFSTCNVAITLNTGASFSASDYNDVSNCNDAAELLGTSEPTLAGWQAGTGLDAHSTNGDPLLNSASTPPYQLGSVSSAAYRTGTNLTAYCASVPAICTDYAGNARPASGAWDMGAFVYGGTAPHAATPVCTPGSGTYNAAQTVTCTNPSSAPVMCYTINGAAPATNGLSGCTVGTPMTSGVTISSTGTNLQVVAGGAGFNDSTASSTTYALAAQAPTYSPAGGVYSTAQNVTISTTPSSASILYCFDTSNTCTPATTYSGAIAVSSSGYLRSQATLSGFTSSPVTTALYSIGVAPPIALVQANNSWTACPTNSSTCSITVRSTGAGHAGVLMFVANPGVFISSVTTDGAWIVPTGCQSSLLSGQAGAVSCAYNLNLTGGTTTETVILNSSSPNSYCYLMFYELSSTGTFSLDAVGGTTDTTASTAMPGVTLTTTGSNDFIAQAFRYTTGYLTSVSKPYVQNGNGYAPAFARFVYATNATSGAAPTLTANRAATAAVGAIAISVH